METIGEKIRRIRKSKGISQMTVADTCNIKQSSYANIESGKTQNITIEIGEGIAKALDVSFIELFEIETQGNVVSDFENLLNEKNAKIADLQKQIMQKDLLIEMLQKERDIYKKSVIGSIESYFYSKIAEIKEKIENAKNEEEIQYFKKMIEHTERNRKLSYENFIHIGFLSKEEIDNYYNSLDEHYRILSSNQTINE